ncbi:autophagy-related protein 9A-like [Tigriopus californicus]|uniref:autophagy-related protein 9A-like n=1 Tax=Tigriopus californicus TaxID=6832 RepID=UPI0027DA57A1|nr:autophagy-related protein 9A-like [Tigriopus californicus]
MSGSPFTQTLQGLDRLQTGIKPFQDDPNTTEDDEAPPHFGQPYAPNDPWREPRRHQAGAGHHSPEDQGPPGDFIIHSVPESNKSRWSHIDDLDSFFKRVYEYHQRHGFYVMICEDVLKLVKFVFVVVIAVVIFECVNYPVLFKNEQPSRPDWHVGDKITPSDIFLRSDQIQLSGLTLLGLLLACVFWLTKVGATAYHFFQYWDIKMFFNEALRVSDDELSSVSWPEVQKRIIKAQSEYLMCIHKDHLTELDIYHRILRFKNYFVAMVNKDLLPVEIQIPFLGAKTVLSQGLKYNLEFLFFKGPWATFNQWHLRDEYKKTSQKKELVDSLQKKIAFVALGNLILMPVILLWQVLNSFFSHAELIKRKPELLSNRTWSLYSRFYLRHFNELDHEFQGRLNRAYKPATKYMDLFSNPLHAVIFGFFRYICGAIMGIILVLICYDEDVMAVEHVLTLLSILTFAVIFSSSFIPDENLVFNPEKSLTAVLAHVHYFPETWKGRAHTHEVMGELGELFPFKAEYLIGELFSPILTPFILFFNLRPKAPQLVDFFRNFTVDVVGVGDVCSFAQMDVRRHGNAEWQTAITEDTPAKTNHYTQAEDGKTEMSLVHFTLTNPDWVPPSESTNFIAALRGHAAKDAEALATVQEEALEENSLYNSLNSMDAAGGLYSSIANEMLGDARHVRMVGPSGSPGAMFLQSTRSPNGDELEGGEQYVEGSLYQTRTGSMLESVHQGLVATTGGTGRSSMMISSHFRPNQSQLLNSRLVGPAASTLMPTPNLGKDLRRLGLEYIEADMSFSALYLHELHHRMAGGGLGSTSQTTTSTIQSNRRNLAEASRYEFQRGNSLNELDEESLPLVDVGDNHHGPLLGSSLPS